MTLVVATTAGGRPPVLGRHDDGVDKGPPAEGKEPAGEVDEERALVLAEREARREEGWEREDEEPERIVRPARKRARAGGGHREGLWDG